MKKHHYGNGYECRVCIYNEVTAEGERLVQWVGRFGSYLSAMRFIRKHYPNREYSVHSMFYGIAPIKNFSNNVDKYGRILPLPKDCVVDTCGKILFNRKGN